MNIARFINNTQVMLQCPKCNNCVEIRIKGDVSIDLVSNNSSIERLNTRQSYEFGCPICHATMKTFRNCVNRFCTILAEIMGEPIFLHTYTPPKYKGVKIIDGMLADDYDYPSLVLIDEESDKWSEIMDLIETIVEASIYNDKVDAHKDVPGVRGAFIIKLNEVTFNKYFISTGKGMHEFTTEAETYFFDLIDIIASELEDYHAFNNKGEK